MGFGRIDRRPAVLRRSVIGTSLAVVAALGLSACGGGGDEAAGSTTVRVTLANHVWTDNIKKALPEFEKQSGLKVELTQLGEDQLAAVKRDSEKVGT